MEIIETDLVFDFDFDAAISASHRAKNLKNEKSEHEATIKDIEKKKWPDKKKKEKKKEAREAYNEICRNYFYFKSYESFISMGAKALNLTKKDKKVKKDKKEIEADTYALAVAVYGWMPTIPKTFNIDFLTDEIKTSISKLKHPEEACAFLKRIDEPILNNSWVGTSKLLHFLKPEIFPIWDSRIARVVDKANSVGKNDKIKNSYMGNRKNYKAYACKMVDPKSFNIERVKDFQYKFKELFNYEPSVIRSLEMALFFNEKK